ncbi:MAG: hypothetical protein ACT4O0_03130 [Pseudonocardia sp.]
MYGRANFDLLRNGTDSCLVRIDTVANWQGGCGRNQPGSPVAKRNVTIPVTDRAARYSLTVTATNAEGSDTSATTTVKNTVGTAGGGGKSKVDDGDKSGSKGSTETGDSKRRGSERGSG